MKKLLLCGAVALSLIGLVLIGNRNDGYGDRRDKENRGDEARPYRRGPVSGTVNGAVDVARGTGHAVGHAVNNIFGHHHRGFEDSRGDYYE